LRQIGPHEDNPALFLRRVGPAAGMPLAGFMGKSQVESFILSLSADDGASPSERPASWGLAPPARSPGRVLSALLAVAILIYSFVFCFKAGERGFFALDQSIEFDGAYRILSGQVPYKDFLIPVGPGVFWVQAIVFQLLGVSFTSFLLGAAVVNLLATALAMFTVATLFPQNRWPALIAGFLTATWFYPPYGTPNMEQTAFFFSLLGIACLTATARDGCQRGVIGALLCVTAGICAVLAFLSKQNAGLLIVPVYFLLLLAAHLPVLRASLVALAWFFVGVAGSVGAFAGWLFVQSDPALFIEHFFRIPSREGIGRIFGGRPHLLGDLLGGNASFLPTAMYLSGAVGIVVLLIFGLRRSRVGPWSRPALAAILCVYLQFFQNAFSVTTCNQWQECMPYVGIVFGCASGLLALLLERQAEATTHVHFGWDAATALLVASIIASLVVRTTLPEVAACVLIVVGLILGMLERPGLRILAGVVPGSLSKPNWQKRREQLAIFTAVVTIGCGIQGIRAAWIRSVHDIFRGATFAEHAPTEGLEHLKWGHPTVVNGAEFTFDDMSRVIARLKQEGKPFFVFPEFTILYGLVGATSPQPLLWFHKGLTYSSDYNERLDRWIVDSLVQNEVQFFVLQKSWHFKDGLCALDHFPLLDSYLRDNFTFDEQHGAFAILRQNPDGPASVAIKAQPSPR
jgi:4-amino-4-deoxy-L-arabinose transferase-like glycosyltransferase